MLTTALPQSPEVAQLRNGLWTAQIDNLTSGWYARPEDERTPRYDRPLTEQSRYWAQILGTTGDEMTVHMVREHHDAPTKYGNDATWRDVRLVSAKPFVVVKVCEPGQYNRRTRYGFAAARQVHGGHLGRKPYLTLQPTVVSSNMRDPDGRLNRTINWVRLKELTEITRLDAADILRDYAPFSPSTYYEPNVPVAQGPLNNWSSRVNLNILRLYTDTELPQGYCGGEGFWGGDNADTLEARVSGMGWNPNELWVPQTFANLVIRLSSFGYRPGQPLPDASCQIAVPMPVQPQLPLPVLPVEELKELHSLRMELVEELPQGHFRQAALSALGFLRGIAWSKVPESDDGGSFRYYTNFEQAQRVVKDGRVIIGACYWTRGGAAKSPHHYAGFLAVFPKNISITDARRDPRAILRVWFWPDSLVRETPDGSKGGLCPPEVPTDCARLVERFLLNLGYDF